MMKRILPIALSAMIGGAAVWFFMQGDSEVPQTAADSAKETKAHSRAAEDPGSRGMAESPRDTKGEDRRTGEQEEAAEGSDGEVVVNLGKVEDIGRQAAELLLSRSELARLRTIPVGDRTPGQRKRLLELERQTATALGLLPEIASFQDDPDEYARFFGSLLQQAAGLDEAQTAAVSDYMRSRAEAMIAGGLNAANEPDDPELEEAWEKRCDEFNEGTAKGVAQILPPGEADRVGFTPGFLELMEQDFDKAD